jgi:hypothetical protein
MSNLALKLTNRLKVAHKAPQETTSGLLSLLLSANFERARIVIADHELSDNFLTLYLEDKQDFKDNLEDLLMYKLPISKFAGIIASENLNSYPGVKYTECGREYDAQIEINTPIKWYEQDANIYQQKIARETALEHILKSL